MNRLKRFKCIEPVASIDKFPTYTVDMAATRTNQNSSVVEKKIRFNNMINSNLQVYIQGSHKGNKLETVCDFGITVHSKTIKLLFL